MLGKGALSLTDLRDAVGVPLIRISPSMNIPISSQ